MRFEVLHQRGRIDTAQVEALAARQHRDRHLADLGGGEHELHVRRRLFQRLQQRVERRAREHVHFVEDIDLVARRHRRIAHRLVDLAHVVDAVMRGGVHLDHVDVPAVHDRLALHAEHRHVDRRAFDRAVGQFVIQRARQNARGGRLPDAAHAGQDPGLRDAAGLERVRDRAHHRFLSDQVGEGRGAIFARQHAIRRAARCGRANVQSGARGVVHPDLTGVIPEAAQRLSGIHNPKIAWYGRSRGYGFRARGFAAPRNDSVFGSGRLTSDPSRSSLGLLPSGPDPVGEWLVHRQPPGSYIGRTKQECKRPAAAPC